MLLEINNLAVSYGGNPPTVEGFSLSMKEGEIVGIVGESGSGKTTVIRSVLGALPEGAAVSCGGIKFCGEPISSFSREQWRKIRGSRMSMIFQDCGSTMNPIRRIGAQYIEYILTHRPEMSKDDARSLACGMLTKMRLPDADNIMESYPHQLSGGMKQRVGIAMAMTFSPELLLADEPTSALDVTTQAQIVREMTELRGTFGTGIIIVTHNLGVAAYMSDQLIVMQRGKIVDAGSADEVIGRPKDEYTKRLLAAVPRMGGERFV